MTGDDRSVKARVLNGVRNLLLNTLEKPQSEFTVDDSIIVRNLYDFLEAHATIEFLFCDCIEDNQRQCSE